MMICIDYCNTLIVDSTIQQLDTYQPYRVNCKIIALKIKLYARPTANQFLVFNVLTPDLIKADEDIRKCFWSITDNVLTTL